MNKNFKVEEFKNAKFSPRTDKVSLPDMKKWFNEEPEIHFRNLTAGELIFVEDALNLLKQNNINLSLTKRILQISISTGIDQDAVSKISEVYPIEFMELYGKIIEITAKGAVNG